MAGLDPAIHESSRTLRKKMDCRVKPGDDEGQDWQTTSSTSRNVPRVN
jgi:hypothetical protein